MVLFNLSCCPQIVLLGERAPQGFLITFKEEEKIAYLIIFRKTIFFLEKVHFYHTILL